MGPTSIIHAGEAGLTSVVEGMAKARGALPDNIREAADRKLGADSTLGKGVLAMVDTVAEESAKAKATKAALAVEAAAASTAVAAAADERALALVEAADSAAKESRGRGGKVLLGGLALGAAAAGAYLVWRRRQQAAIESLSGEGQWAPAGGGTVSDLSAKMSSAASEVAEQVPDAASDAVDQVSMPHPTRSTRSRIPPRTSPTRPRTLQRTQVRRRSPSTHRSTRSLTRWRPTWLTRSRPPRGA